MNASIPPKAPPSDLAARLARLGRPLGVCLDYDGTLVPITLRPMDARLDAPTRELLERLAHRPDLRVAIITGRSLEGLREVAGRIEGVEIAVNGGLQVLRGEDAWIHPGAEAASGALRKVADSLKKAAAAYPGAFLEDKGLTLALHYRAAPDAEAPLAVAVREAMALAPGLRVIHGKAIFEIQPDVPWDKGAAVSTLLDRWGIERSVFFAGDDTIDEPGFELARRRGGLGLLVGERASAADVRVGTPEELRAVLRALAGG